MYQCRDCGCEFETAGVEFERHGLDCPPYERILVCPVCRSTDFEEQKHPHCRCCGALLPPGRREYCSDACRVRGKKLWEQQQHRRTALRENPLVMLVREADEYNRLHGTCYTYGQYTALIRPKLERQQTKKGAKK